MSEGLEAGAAAPEFDLPVDGGGRASLSGLKGKKVVLYFYPKDDTSGCTAEAIAFNGLRDKFEAAGAFLLGVSPDSVKSHDKFKKKYGLQFALGSRRDEIDARGLRRVAGKEHVRPQIHGRGANDVPDRRRRANRSGLAKGESARSRRRGAGGGAGALNQSSRNSVSARAESVQPTPSFRCRLVDEVVYWNTSFFSGYM